jgi:hypothetical protein
MPEPEIQHSPAKGNALKLNEFRANQYKETFSTRFNEKAFARAKVASSAKPNRGAS